MSRQVLVQRLLLPSNGSVNPTGQQNNNHNNSTQQTLMPSNSTATNSLSLSSLTKSSPTPTTTVTATAKSAVKTNEVPSSNQTAVDKYKPQTTTATTITTTTSNNFNQNSPKHDACNTTFLNSLKLNAYEEMPQTSTSQYNQQTYQQEQELMNSTNQDNIDGLTAGGSGIPSVDSAFDESSSKSENFKEYELNLKLNVFHRCQFLKWFISHASFA